MDNQNKSQVSSIQPSTRDSRVTINYWSRDVDVFQVFDHEFKSIKSAASNSGLYLAFFGISFGVMVSLLLVLTTVDVRSPYAFASFVVAFAASVLATALLGIKARIEFIETRKQIDYIEERSRKRGVPTQPLS